MLDMQSFRFVLDEAIAKHNGRVLQAALIGLPTAALISSAAAVGAGLPA